MPGGSSCTFSESIWIPRQHHVRPCPSKFGCVWTGQQRGGPVPDLIKPVKVSSDELKSGSPASPDQFGELEHFGNQNWTSPGEVPNKHWTHRNLRKPELDLTYTHPTFLRWVKEELGITRRPSGSTDPDRRIGTTVDLRWTRTGHMADPSFSVRWA